MIPQPDDPSSDSMRQGDQRVNCPHMATGGTLVDWFHPTTWASGSIPGPGDNVALPSNTNVVLSASPGVKLGLITIPATSSLILGEQEGAALVLDIDGMDVQGSLIAGSESCRIEQQIIIQLHGSRPLNGRREESYKGLSVTGTLSLHGKRFVRTWSRLAKEADAGDDVVLLQDAVNWEPGQEIVVVTTAMKDSREWHQNEVHVVGSVHTNHAGIGAAVYLKDSTLAYHHAARNEYQAEVGLLSRYITIQGAPEDSLPTDPDPLTCVAGSQAYPPNHNRFGDSAVPCPDKELTGFGGHVMVHGSGKGYVEGVEFFRMGK